jgi:hypothetical protein
MKYLNELDRILAEADGSKDDAANHLIPDIPNDIHGDDADVMKMTPEERKRWSRLHSGNPYTRAAATWEIDGNDEHEVELYLDKHRQFNTLNVLQGQQRDIGYLLKHSTWAEFKSLIDTAEKSYNKKQKKKDEIKSKESDADVVFENDKILIISPRSYEASCKYGYDSQWCVASVSTRSHWDSYTGNGGKFFYCLSKVIPRLVLDTDGNVAVDPRTGKGKINDYYKVAVLVYAHDKNMPLGNIPIEVWTSSDHLTYTTERGKNAATRSRLSDEERRLDPLRRFGRWLTYHGVTSPDKIFVNPKS